MLHASRHIRRIALVIGAALTALAIPANALAVQSSDGLSSYDFGTLWSTTAAQSKTFTFNRSANCFFGCSYDKVDGVELVSTPANALAVTTNTCNTGYSFPNNHTCQVTVKFDPSVGPAASGSLKVLSTFDNSVFNDWDATIAMTGSAAQQQVAGPPGEAGPGCTTDPSLVTGAGVTPVVVLCERGTRGKPGKDGNNGAAGPGCSTDPNDVSAPGDLPIITLCEKGAQGEKGDSCTNDPAFVTAAGVSPVVVLCPKGDKGDPGVDGNDGAQGAKGDTGATGAQGVQGVQGVAGHDAVAAPQQAALGGGKAISHKVRVRTSCVIRRNKAKRRIAKCVVKIPAHTPKSTWALTSGGTRIAHGAIKAGKRSLVIKAVIPKSLNGWISVRVTK